MNKKILIASLFATLMLLVPMTSVVGFSDISLNRKIEKIEDNNTITETYDNEDCGCQPVSNLNLVRFERLSNRLEKLSNKLEIYTNIVSILSKNNLVIAEKYKDSSNEIVTLKELNEELKTDIIFQDSSFICDILETIFNNVEEMLYYYEEKAIEAEEAGNNLLVFLYLSLWFLYLSILRIIYEIGCNLGCWGPP